MSKPDPQFFDQEYAELLELYRSFGASIATGCARSAGKTERKLILDLEREIARRENAGETGSRATLTLGGNRVEIRTK